MPIHPTDGRNLKHKLQSWVLSGHSQSDAAKIANILGSANTAAEVQMKLLDKETCLPPRGFDMSLLSSISRDYSLADGKKTVVLSFSFFENPNPGYSVVRIL